MRIIDVCSSNAITNVTLYLKAEEAKELYDSLGTLIKMNSFGAHIHVCDMAYKHEVTVVVYDEEHIESLDERSKTLILTDS